MGRNKSKQEQSLTLFQVRQLSPGVGASFAGDGRKLKGGASPGEEGIVRKNGF